MGERGRDKYLVGGVYCEGIFQGKPGVGVGMSKSYVGRRSPSVTRTFYLQKTFSTEHKNLPIIEL